MSDREIFITALVVVFATAILRLLPFIIIRKSIAERRYIQYLGDIIPYAMIALLVIYCIKDINIIKFPYGLPEIISIIVVAIFQIIKRNVLISIGLGTVIYMFLVQVIFV
ncbi:branched-chain amino acid transporter permease [Brachyspira sp. SAP_772]|uniref:branched-chain amino acid transporter permease n=1 Tax=Brachyspira sp. SAP_772 TaxID=2608385 RepID=UPI0012F51711|nr:AzlD domain-containing protein [Brachyspira sp. SAP_772]